MKVLELFGGIGAPRAALERIGFDFEIVDYVEIDKFAVKSYNAIYGENYEPQDITEWDKDIDVDLVVHGSPCQDFSTAGQQAGGEQGSGTRSSLMWHTVRIVDKLKPKFVIWENVKNVLGKRHKSTFDKYVEHMGDLGYTSHYSVLNARDYGIPQNRERVFVISVLNDEREFMFPEKVELEIYLQDLLENHVDNKYFLSDKMISYLTDDSGGYKRSAKFNKNTKDDDGKDHIGTITTREGNVVDSTFIRVKNATKKGYLNARDGDGVDLSYPNSLTRRGRVQRNVSQTLTTNDSKVVVTKNGDVLSIRKLTPRECWRLMGFTDDQFDKAEQVSSNAQLYKQAGNSIVVDVLVHLLNNLIDSYN